MSIILKADNFTVPEESALDMRGLQTDSFGTVYGGHKAIFDPLQYGITGTLATGTVLQNLVFEKPTATVTSGLTTQTVAQAKGFPFAITTGATEYISLPDVFNLLTLGNEPSVVVSAWLTNRDLSIINQGVVGCAYKVTLGAQWYISTGIAAGKLRLAAQGLSTDVTPTLNVPELYTIYFKRISAGVVQIQFARNGTVVSTQNSTYPFRNPVDQGSAAYGIPKLGYVEGFGYTWNGVVHRIQVFKVNPTTFNLTSWLSTEYSLNNARFVI